MMQHKYGRIIDVHDDDAHVIVGDKTQIIGCVGHLIVSTPETRPGYDAGPFYLANPPACDFEKEPRFFGTWANAFWDADYYFFAVKIEPLEGSEAGALIEDAA